jgi:DNA-binding XRE family transcriptional regulator
VKNPQEIQSFGRQLRKVREQHNMSQQDLADEAEISKITIQRIENAKYGPTLDVLISIARAFKMSVSSLTENIKSDI